MQIANNPPPGTVASGPPPSPRFLSSTEGELAVIIIGLGVFVIIAMAVVLRNKAAPPDESIRAFTIILVIIGTLVLICAGYSNDQIAPAIGLFGTIAGYLLGRKGAE
jgi:hypothetical protein